MLRVAHLVPATKSGISDAEMTAVITRAEADFD